jgi:hypothetical protein
MFFPKLILNHLVTQLIYLAFSDFIFKYMF